MIISYGLQMKPDWLAHLIQGGEAVENRSAGSDPAG